MLSDYDKAINNLADLLEDEWSVVTATRLAERFDDGGGAPSVMITSERKLWDAIVAAVEASGGEEALLLVDEAMVASGYEDVEEGC